jgi:hypothetical protein
MPRITVTADLGDKNDLVNASNFLNIVARAAVSGKLYSEIEAEDTPVPLSGTGTGKPNVGMAEAAGEGPTARSPEPEAEPEPAAEPKKRTTKSKDIFVYNHLGEKLAGFTHSEMAVGRMIIEAEKITCSVDLQNFAAHNMASFSRLAKDDADKLTAVVTKQANMIRDGRVAAPEAATDPQTTPATETPTTEASSQSASPDTDLLAAFGAPAEPEVSELPPMSKSDFAAAFVKIGKALGPHEAPRWLKSEGFEDPTGIPASEYARLVAAGEKHIASLKA